MLIEADNSRAACIIEMEVRNEPSYIEVKKDYFHEVINNVKKITQKIKEGGLIKLHAPVTPPARVLLKKNL